MAEYTSIPFRRSIVDLLVNEHRYLKHLYNEYHAVNIATENRQKLAWCLIRQLSIHTSKAEEVLIPVVSEKLGLMAAQTLLSEFMDLKNLTATLSCTTIEKQGQAQFDAMLKQVMTQLDKHIDEVDETFIPKLCRMDGVDEDFLCKLGAKFDAAGAHAVSRPHPWAPNKAPLNRFVNYAIAPMDYVMDLYRFGLNPPEPPLVL